MWCYMCVCVRVRVGVGACMCVCVCQWDFQQTVADVDQTTCVFLFSSRLLQECIKALGHKGSHLPFRVSVLTQVCMYIHACVFMCCVFLCVHVLCDIPFLCYPLQVLKDSFVGDNSLSSVNAYTCTQHSHQPPRPRVCSGSA